MRDLFNNIHAVRVFSPVATAGADNTALVGQIIDHQGYDSACYLIGTGTLADADATFAVLLEESDDSGMAGAVTATELNGTLALAGFAFGDDTELRKLGYRGGKRYTRLTITPANNTGAAPIIAICLLGGMHRSPAPALS